MGDEKQLSFYTLGPAHTQLHANDGHDINIQLLEIGWVQTRPLWLSASSDS
jgi:hypothetical protein